MAGIDTIYKVTRTYRHARRYNQIIRVLVRNGFGFLLDTIQFHMPASIRAFWKRWKADHPGEEMQIQSVAERVSQIFVELGPTFVKLGQMLASRPDLIPIEYVREFARLQDNVPPFSMNEVRQVIREDLHGEIEDFFEFFDEKPVGAASMAQGHHARLKDGRDVFVKIQRPGIRREVQIDIEILEYLAANVERQYDEFRYLHPVRIVEEFTRSLSRELDFCVELTSQQRFYRQFEGREGIKVPMVYPAYSSQRILTMEFIQGIKASDVDGLLKAGMDLKVLSSLGADLALEQFLQHGFFHADPHPGNMFILPGNVICYVDFGSMGMITKTERGILGNVLLYLIMKKYRLAVQYLLKLTIYDGEPDCDELERDVEWLMDRYSQVALADIQVGDALADLYQICQRQGLGLKPNIYMMLRALSFIDELGLRLDPDFQLMDHLRPYTMKLMFRRYEPVELLQQLVGDLSDWGRLAGEFPQTFRSLTRAAMSGRLTMKQEFVGLKDFRHGIDKGVNRLASSVMLAGMLVGSSMILHAGVGPAFMGVSALGLLGFLFSFPLAVWLLWSIMKSGTM